MSNKYVKITIDDDNDPVLFPKWCIVFSENGCGRTLCTKEVYGYGEGNAVGEEKTLKRFPKDGCKKCLAKIKEIKAVRL